MSDQWCRYVLVCITCHVVLVSREMIDQDVVRVSSYASLKGYLSEHSESFLVLAKHNATQGDKSTRPEATC